MSDSDDEVADSHPHDESDAKSTSLVLVAYSKIAAAPSKPASSVAVELDDDFKFLGVKFILDEAGRGKLLEKASTLLKIDGTLV